MNTREIEHHIAIHWLPFTVHIQLVVRHDWNHEWNEPILLHTVLFREYR